MAFNSEENFSKFSSKIWLASPTMHGDEIEYINEAYNTNWMSTLGANIDAIEKTISEIIGCKYAVALASGTSALHLAVITSGIKRGDRVFCSDVTFAATANPIKYVGAEPIFIDSEYETWNMDPKALERAFELYPDVKYVMLAHLYGTPAKMDEIIAVCKKNGAVLIEDAAESFGATYNGVKTGSFGDYSVISFNGNKIITGSSGGMFLSNDKETADLVRKLSTQARDNAPWYQHTMIGYNYRMSNVIAGVVRGQVPYLQEHIDKKRDIYNRYKNGFKGLPVKMNPYTDKSVPNFWLSCMIIDEGAMCRQERTDSLPSFKAESGKTCPTEILETLSSLNIEGRPIWKPMHLQPIFSDCKFVSVCEHDVGSDIFARGLCLPSDNKMTPEIQDVIIEVIKHCFD